VPVADVAPGVYRAGTKYVNWYIVDGGDGLTLIDAGLPGYRSQLHASLSDIGRSVADVRALVLTHGHIDHVGMADVLAADGVDVYLHPADAALASDYKKNKTERSAARYLHWPGTWSFLAHCIAQGATKPRTMPATKTIDDARRLDVPGTPTVTHAPGHTDGSVVLEFEEHGVVFVGDLFCTISSATGRAASPRLQSRASNRDSNTAMQSVDRLEGITAKTVLPGHGVPWKDGVEAAAAKVREFGCY
jgi:glyoxylase-like metal-dependent hydrolase (beta-lactamase superfamily II)